MRILNEDNDKKIDCVSIFLTRDEAIQMIGFLKDLMNNPKNHHAHLSSGDYQKEITLCLYDLQDIESFHPRAKKLILKDE
ncbi:MAG: hypothetical protein K940chlam7_01134 [Chlamydiae bacterium]|nr:hypothetical protein [Chlamydiota bacterium]